MDDMKKMTFSSSSPHMTQFLMRRPKLLDYFEKTWLRGSFPPAMWNLYNKVTHLTNNPQEGYNSKLNKLVQTHHPNPNVLLHHVSNLLIDAELKSSKTMVNYGFSLFIFFIIVFL